VTVRARELISGLRRVDPIRLDVLTAVVCLAVAMFQVWSAVHDHNQVAQTVVAVLLATAVAVRRRALLTMLLVLLIAFVVIAVVAGTAATNGPGGVVGSLMGLLLFYGGGAYLTGWRSLVALAFGLTLTTQTAFSTGDLVVANLLWDDLVIGLLPWFLGRMMRDRSAQMRAHRERAERLDAEREMHMRVAALAERARLAREIHDVIAHSVSVMVIQAAGARTVMGGDSTRADEALGAVERAGREALAEMRRLLGVLGDGEHLRALAPQPGLDDLEELIARTTAAGLPASIEVVGEPVSVPPGLSLCAYRVVQEALTNTIKHAGAGQAAVCVRWHPDLLEVEVADDGRGQLVNHGIESGGHGIVGMRERTALHGGEVEAGPAPAGGFAVRARIPLASEALT
jgi:signal transduction histidine kinase